MEQNTTCKSIEVCSRGNLCWFTVIVWML